MEISSSRGSYKIKYLQPIVAYLISIIALQVIFVGSMLNYYNGEIQWSYLGFASIRIALISLIPAIAVYLLKIQKWYISAVISLLLGIGVAVAYVQISV